MNVEFKLLEKSLNKLEKDIIPKWGKMNPIEMVIHCNNFIEVSFGIQKINFISKISGRIFGRLYLKYLSSLNFNIYKYPKNSRTLNEFKPFLSRDSFTFQKKRLAKNLKMVDGINSNFIKHNIYGKIKTDLFKKLVFFHTSYHLNQFGVLNNK